MALRHRHSDIAILLLPLSLVDSSEASHALLWASSNDELALAQALCASRGLDINFVDDIAVTRGQNEYSALRYAVERNDIAMLRILLASPGIDVNAEWMVREGNASDSESESEENGIGKDQAQPESILTALLLAARGGKLAIVHMLLAAPGINLNARDEEGKTALMLACAAKNAGIVALLLARPELDVNKTVDAMDMAPLHIAAKAGDVRLVQRLASDLRIKINLGSRRKITALWQAVAKGHFGCVQVLLAVPGIDVNATDSQQTSVLPLACAEGRKDIVQALLATPGIDVNRNNRKNRKGEHALWQSAKDGSTKITALLRELLAVCGIPAHVQIAMRSGALHLAVEHGSLESLRLLLRARGIDVNGGNDAGKTALHLPAQRGQADLLQLLLNAADIDVNARSRKGKTALKLAYADGEYRNAAIIDALLKAGADVDEYDARPCAKASVFLEQRKPRAHSASLLPKGYP